MLKRRMGKHTTDIRELTLNANGVTVGPRLSGMQGVLTGVPRLVEADA